MNRQKAEILELSKAEVTLACEKYAKEQGKIGQTELLRLVELNPDYRQDAWVTAEISVSSAAPLAK